MNISRSIVSLSFLLGVALCGCGPRIYKCTFEKKLDDGTWEKRCETFDEDEVYDVDSYCDKYEGVNSYSVTPSDTTYSGSTENRNAELQEGACEPEDGRED